MNDMQQIYGDLGFVGPLEAFDRSEMLALSETIRDELDRNPELPGRRNRHLDWEVAKRLTTNETIINAMIQILGSDIVL